MLRLSEIFYSIQGEGVHAGRPAIFIRLAGCNLSCDFCDTDHTEKFQLDTMGVWKSIGALTNINMPAHVPMVVITGGEPLLQYDEVKELVRLLRRNYFFVAVETNGTVNVDWGSWASWLTVSPKSYPPVQKRGDELKLIYTGQEAWQIQRWASYYFAHYVLQPCWVEDNEKLRKYYINGAIEFVKKNPIWRLGLQCQKFVNIR